MNSILNKQALRKLNPLQPAPLLAEQSGRGFAQLESGETAEKHIVQISFERELPLPIAIAHQSHEMRLNTFRCFGINE